VNIRNAEPADLDLLMSLVERLESELPDLPYPEGVAAAEVERMVNDGVRRRGGWERGRLPLARYGDHGPTTVCVGHLGRRLSEGLDSAGAPASRIRSTAAHTCCSTSTRRTGTRPFYNHLGFEERAKIFTLRSDAAAGTRVARRSIGALHVQAMMRRRSSAS
jgi:hypothetical protein